MSILAIQTAVGSIGSKAATVLSYDASSLLNIGKFQYKGGPDGLYILNQSDTDTTYTKSFTLATTDLGIENPKHCSFLYIGVKTVSTNTKLNITLTNDKGVSKTVPYIVLKVGLQRLRVPMGHINRGRYIKLKISSDNSFRIDNIEGYFTVVASRRN
jgi:hypothetical protein